YTKHFQAPMLSRIGYDLNVSQRLNDYLQFNFYALFGKLGANERNAPNNRNLNFESQIRVGGINLLYNFDNFLPKNRDASPYISLGFESFEFLTKTDLYDQYGNRYYYWSDGSTRNIDEHAANAASAIIIKRDYKYESDVREMNLDGFGKYPERSFAIPLGVGAIFKISDSWDFKFGTTMHFTFTDYIDGVSDKSLGNRAGNKSKDKFMMTSFSLHYKFGMKDKEDEEKDEDQFNDVDFFALDLSDLDKDGVPDTKDSCQGTPPGVAVDAKGCPIDDDNDGVPNYKDDELNTPKDAFVDIKGVQLTDSIIDYQYRYYMDSTGAFATVETHEHNGRYISVNQKEYTIEIGSFKTGLPPELMTKFLSISDISSTSQDDSTTIYTAGKYNSLLDAENRKKQLISEGLKDAKIVYKQNGKFIDAPKYDSNLTGTNNNTNNNTANNNSNHNTNNTNNNNNTANNNNSNHNNNNNTANNNSNHNTNNNTGNNTTHNTNNANNTNNTANNNSNNNANNSNNSNSEINSKGIVLRVQLGAYHNKLSKRVFKDVPDLIEIKTEDGLYKYMTGSFTTIDAAAKHKVDLLLKGYQDAFITAYKDGKRISLAEAGAVPMKKETMNNPNDSSAISSVDKTLITFKVQVGVFKSEPPADKQAKFDKIKGILKEPTPTGLNRYTIGPFSDYKKAQEAKNEMIKNYGIEDAFILAFFKNEYISIQEALELLK
ncbi:MAG: SPOR domain-containing protein, partial [Bacteroidia bacterium]